MALKEARGRPRASFTLRGPERYVRIEVVSPSGRSAWTNRLFLED
jgi:hypothetical protein